MLPRRSELDALAAPDRFCWATGIEDTFITAPWPRTGRALDEYELTDHYGRWEADLGLMAELGVGAARYGVPWHRVNPAPGTWDWRAADAPLERLLTLGIDPIVDLVHYGVPPWIPGAFLSPEFPARVAEFAARLAERFAGRIRWYTPFNEPRIAAWYCGRLGWWPPYRRGWRGFLDVLVGICRGVVAIDAALRAVDPDIVVAHVDATDLYEAATPAVADEANRRQAIVFLALDLLTGRVGPDHPLAGWLARHGFGEKTLVEFRERPLALDVVGLNLYPMYTYKRIARTAAGVRIRMPYATAALVERLADLYWTRYGRPVLITETASAGGVARRQAWLADSVAAVRRARARGVPVVGYTWWPMFALVAWAYRQGIRPVDAYLVQMGLWDLDESLARVPTALVPAYRDLAAGGARAVGPLARAS